MNTSDISNQLLEQIKQHIANKQPMRIHGSDSKLFYGRTTQGTPLDVSPHSGVVHYEPTELIITARSGTRLADVQATLAEHNQMLAFEPPSFSETATLGGCIATGLSGPSRPFSGSVRDFVLGMTIINGRGEQGKFGGEVMKNVAGYDISRMMVGSFGTLGVILDVSLKVLPKPEAESTISYELTEDTALSHMNKFCNASLPISATCFDGNRLHIRLCGTESAVNAAKLQFGGETLEHADTFWSKIREQTHPFFNSEKPLWRLSLAPATPPIDIDGKQLIEWRGAQRWLLSNKPAQRIREIIEEVGGHATLFRRADNEDDIFHPIHGKLRELHINVKLAMDPYCLFNVGRMYPDI